MLILGFLRSAANLLILGPVPSSTSTKKKKKTNDDDDDDDDDDVIVDEGAPADPHEENGFIIPKDRTDRTRGTILITLRNVPPYTLWYGYSHLVQDVILMCIAIGMLRAWLKSHHYQHQAVHHPIRATFNYDLLRSIEVRGMGMSIV
jgi:hypothetical protein